MPARERMPGKGGKSYIAPLLVLLAWAYLFASVAGAWVVWSTSFGAGGIPVGAVQAAMPTLAAPIALALLAGVLLQGLVGFAVLQALASITRDLRAIRINSRPGAAAHSTTSAPISTGAAASDSAVPHVRCEECGREVPETEIVNLLGKNVCQKDYQRWLAAS